MQPTHPVLATRLARWNPQVPDLRDWSDDELRAALLALGIATDREQFRQAGAGLALQSTLEDDWLEQAQLPADQDAESLQAFVFLSVQELWERWLADAWPTDRLARMWLYLTDADFSVQWADSFHAPAAVDIVAAMEQHVGTDAAAERFAAIARLAELPDAIWPTKLLDAMGEWCEIGNRALAVRAAELLSRLLGHGHPLAFVAAAEVTARQLDHAVASALQVPESAPLDPRFGELVGYLCLAGGSGTAASLWLHRADRASNLRRTELTYAAETVRNWLAEPAAAPAGDSSEVVPAAVAAAARQAAAQSAYFALISFAGTAQTAMPVL